MTAQIADRILYIGDIYSIIKVTDGELASPVQFGMEAERMHTACYRGFYSMYVLTEDILYLKQLTVKEKNQNYLPIKGIEAQKYRYGYTYHDLSEIIKFTGTIIIAKDFIQELYIHAGYQRAIAFESVYEITFKKGRFINKINLSFKMKQDRKKLGFQFHI